MSELEQRKKALEVEIAKLQIQNLRMKKLSTFTGFYSEFFNSLKESKTHEEAFEKLNEEFFQLFGFYKYNSHDSFKHVVRYHLKK
jgi:hypothetical protein